MKRETLKDIYQIGNLVKDEYGTYGIVIAVTLTKLIVKNKFSTSTYTEIEDLDLFKKTNPVLMETPQVITVLTNLTT